LVKTTEKGAATTTVGEYGVGKLGLRGAAKKGLSTEKFLLKVPRKSQNAVGGGINQVKRLKTTFG